MDLSSLGIVQKEHRVIQHHGGNLIDDFMAGKFQILGLERNSRGIYGGPLDGRLASIFPKMMRELNGLEYCREMLGTTHMYRDSKRPNKPHYVANMFITSGVGLGRSGKNKSTTPVNRFSPRFLTNAVEQILEECDKQNISYDRQIAIQRVYGGLGGVSWQEVQTVLDDLCEKHKFSLHAYLPRNFDTNFVRGAPR